MKFYDMDGNVIGVEEADKLLQNPVRTIGWERRDDVTVSTVFLVIDHNWNLGEDDPVLWETMIFGGPHHEYQERYKTKEEALEGHKRACDLAFSAQMKGAK